MRSPRGGGRSRTSPFPSRPPAPPSPGSSPVPPAPSGSPRSAGPFAATLAPRRSAFLLDLGFLLLASAALIIPSWLASPPERRPRLAGAVEAPRRIHLNRSAWYEWTLLPGIGEARARRIVDFRSSRGGFHAVEDLEEVPGLPRGFAERARPYLTLEDPPGGAPVLR